MIRLCGGDGTLETLKLQQASPSNFASFVRRNVWVVSEAGEREDTVRVQILVVDDELPILELTSLILEGSGVKVRTPQTGYQAIQIVQSDAGISLAILDWRMPGMDGEQLFKHLSAILPRHENYYCERR